MFYYSHFQRSLDRKSITKRILGQNLKKGTWFKILQLQFPSKMVLNGLAKISFSSNLNFYTLFMQPWVNILKIHEDNQSRIMNMILVSSSVQRKWVQINLKVRIDEMFYLAFKFSLNDKADAPRSELHKAFIFPIVAVRYQSRIFFCLEEEFEN